MGWLTYYHPPGLVVVYTNSQMPLLLVMNLFRVCILLVAFPVGIDIHWRIRYLEQHYIKLIPTAICFTTCKQEDDVSGHSADARQLPVTDLVAILDDV